MSLSMLVRKSFRETLGLARNEDVLYTVIITLKCIKDNKNNRVRLLSSEKAAGFRLPRFLWLDLNSRRTRNAAICDAAMALGGEGGGERQDKASLLA